MARREGSPSRNGRSHSMTSNCTSKWDALPLCSSMHWNRNFIAQAFLCVSLSSPNLYLLRVGVTSGTSCMFSSTSTLFSVDLTTTDSQAPYSITSLTSSLLSEEVLYMYKVGLVELF